MARIGIAGFQHETNTFAPVKADLEEFENVAGAPQVPSGDQLFEEMKGLNTSISGFIDEAKKQGHDLIPSLWASATPSAHVTDRAFDTLTGRIVEDTKTAGPLDGVYLCLHGAMVTEHLEDGEVTIAIYSFLRTAGGRLPVPYGHLTVWLESQQVPPMIEEVLGSGE